MGNVTISKQFKFESAHCLPNHQGKCQRLHGHGYKVIVSITGPIKKLTGESDEGMVVDFGIVSDIFKQRIESVCDHQNLNDVLPIKRTTAEILSLWIFYEMEVGIQALSDTAHVSEVKVWETDTSFAIATQESLDGDFWWRK